LARNGRDCLLLVSGLLVSEFVTMLAVVSFSVFETWIWGSPVLYDAGVLNNSGGFLKTSRGDA
jgi:hypothetical protein